jgi:hypothetical protein
MKDDIKEIKSDVKLLLAHLNQQIGRDKEKKANRKSILGKLLRITVAIVVAILSSIGFIKGE